LATQQLPPSPQFDAKQSAGFVIRKDTQ